MIFPPHLWTSMETLFFIISIVLLITAVVLIQIVIVKDKKIKALKIKSEFQAPAIPFRDEKGRPSNYIDLKGMEDYHGGKWETENIMLPTMIKILCFTGNTWRKIDWPEYIYWRTQMTDRDPSVPKTLNDPHEEWYKWFKKFENCTVSEKEFRKVCVKAQENPDWRPFDWYWAR